MGCSHLVIGGVMPSVTQQVKAGLAPLADDEILDGLQIARLDLCPGRKQLHLSAQRLNWHLFCGVRIQTQMDDAVVECKRNVGL